LKERLFEGMSDSVPSLCSRSGKQQERSRSGKKRSGRKMKVRDHIDHIFGFIKIRE
jgi:hypothetical protein